MELYGSGFNAHGQLLPSCSPHDLHSFQRIASGTTIRVRCATWSATVLEIDGVLELRGSQSHNDQAGGCGKDRDLPADGHERNHNKTVAVIRGLPADRIKTIVGDASGILCALTMEGELWLLDEMDQRQGKAPELTKATDGSIAWSLSWVRHDVEFGAFEAMGSFPGREKGEDRKIVIDQIALAGNDRVCISIHTCLTSADSSAVLSHPSTLLTFPSLSSLLSSPLTIISTATLPTSPTSLLGSSTTFQAICESVPYTWGDARHAHLGRDTSQNRPADTPFPAVIPTLVDNDLEPHVQKIAAGGWLAASLTHWGDCYIWGGRLGQMEQRIGERDGNGDWDAKQRFVNVEGGRAVVVDVAVGHGWVLVLTKVGKVWGWGDGTWGQLGMKGNERGWVQGWVEIGGWEEEGKEVVGVECGVWNSFVLTRKKG